MAKCHIWEGRYAGTEEELQSQSKVVSVIILGAIVKNWLKNPGDTRGDPQSARKDYASKSEHTFWKLKNLYNVQIQIKICMCICMSFRVPDWQLRRNSWSSAGTGPLRGDTWISSERDIILVKYCGAETLMPMRAARFGEAGEVRWAPFSNYS